jgi:hypothetical protein
LICHFHVLTYLEKVRHKPEFGKLSEHDHVAIQNHIHRLVYSEKQFQEGDVPRYEENKQALIGACERLGAVEYLRYLERNWFNSTDMWALYTRNKLPHLKNHTNNHLECWLGHFKDGVCESTTMADCVTALLRESRRNQKDYETAVLKPGRYHNENYDDEMAAALLCTTPFVARIIETQYVAAKNKFDSYVFEDDDVNKSVIVHGKASDNVVDLLDFSSACKFVKNMRLPCRHAMAYRAYKKMAPIIPLKLIDVR